MSQRLYPIAVLVFWCSTMTWLVVAKVLPGLRRGDPPDHRLVAISRVQNATPIAWDMHWNMQRIGWAASKVSTLPDGHKEILSRIQFTERPRASSMSTMWLIQYLATVAGDDVFGIQIDNSALLNAAGELRGMHSEVRYNGETGMPPRMSISGEVVQQKLDLKFFLGGM